MIVSKRFPGEVRDVREFVQPDSFMVSELASMFRSPEEAWAWVVKSIRYPSGPPAISDRRYQEAFVAGGLFGIFIPRFKQYSYDFWQFPSETIALRTGDCEDKSILLCSLLRRMGYRAYVTIGRYKDMGHAWVVSSGKLYETVEPGAITAELPPYFPVIRFNEREIVYA